MLRTREFRCHFMPWFFGLLLVPGSNKKGDFLRFAAPGIWRMVIPRWIFGVFPSWDGWHDGTYRTDERRICPHVVLPRYSLQNLLLFFFCACAWRAPHVHMQELYGCCRLFDPAISLHEIGELMLWRILLPVAAHATSCQYWANSISMEGGLSRWKKLALSNKWP